MMRRMGLFALLMVGLALVIRFSGLWDSLLPAGPVSEVNFATLTPPGSPNSYLICPQGVCAAATPDAISPEIQLAPAQLIERILAIAEADGATLIDRRDPNAVEMVVRTPLMRWPDRISARAYPGPGGGSTVALYSRSIYGESDLGANKTRVERWLSRMSQ